jgi:hypothetical protein
LAHAPDRNDLVNGKPMALVGVRRTFSRVQGNYVGSSQARESESLVCLLNIPEIDGK